MPLGIGVPGALARPCLPEQVHVLRGVDPGLVELGEEVHHEVRVGLGGDLGILVVLAEGGEDLLGVVDEVEHVRVGLPRGHAVEPRERLHGGDA